MTCSNMHTQTHTSSQSVQILCSLGINCYFHSRNMICAQGPPSASALQ